MSFFKALQDLISALPEAPLKVDLRNHTLSLPVSQICVDTRQVQPGALFVAIAGHKLDGHDYIQQAIDQGAVAVVYTDVNKLPADISIVTIQVAEARRALERLASFFYDEPSSHLYCIGVTGTNGKTSTTYMVEYLLDAVGVATGVIGTIDHHFQQQIWSGEMTTPDAVSLQKRLFEMKNLGAKAVAMEISSHALEQHRASSVQLDVGVFTNLTRDHLDYHQTMNEYFLAKQKLFSEVLASSSKLVKIAAVHTDSKWGRRLLMPAKLKVATFGKLDADFQYKITSVNFKFTQFELKTPYGVFNCKLPMIGAHNVQNAIGALIAALGYFEVFGDYAAGAKQMGLMIEAMQNFRGVPGRLQMVPGEHPVNVFIDYAHTPDALQNVLRSLQEVRAKSGSGAKIICVFGCGGDRDKGKRPLMAKVAEKLADLVIVTSDNPRTENPQQIIQDICTGFEKIKPISIEARQSAIQDAIEIANPADVILIAGKGHEDYQIIGTQKTYFSDFETAAKLLQQKKM